MLRPNKPLNGNVSHPLTSHLSPLNMRLHVYQTLQQSGFMPLFYHPDPEVAFQLAAACYRGGAQVIEFTNRGPFAHEVFAVLMKRVRRELPGLLLGIGSIQDAGTTALYLQMGADFVIGSSVSGGLSPQEKLNNAPQILMQIVFFQEALGSVSILACFTKQAVSYTHLTLPTSDLV